MKLTAPRPTLLGLAVATLLIVGDTSTLSAAPLGEPGAGGAPTTSVAAPATSSAPSADMAVAPSIQSSLGPYGDPDGVRAQLKARGIEYRFIYIGEVLGNTSGGVKRGASFEGLLNGILDVNLDKFAGLKGAALHANFYQIHGRSLSGNNLLDLITVSTLEAYPATRLYEAWFEQAFANDKAALRVGQIGADVEFFVSQTANVFYNPTFGAPALLANDLPSGGPTYPLAAPAARLKLNPTDHIAVLAALFDGDPAGPYRSGVNNINPQIRDRAGTIFRLKDPPFLLTEAALAYNQDQEAGGLPGTVKAGFLHHFGDFAATNLPGSSGVKYRGNSGVYGLVDQTIYRVPGTSDQGASAFLRAFAVPSDRNLIDLYVDGGVAYKGLVPGRREDTVGAAFAYARVSRDVARFDALAGTPLVRDYQINIEVTYQYVAGPGFSIQPEFQYLIHPGAHGVANPGTGHPTSNAPVFGLRATLQY